MTSLITVGYVLLCSPLLILQANTQIDLIKDVARGEFQFYFINSTINEDHDLLMYEDHLYVEDTLYQTFQTLFKINGIVDVAVYSMFDNEFRKSVKALLMSWMPFSTIT